MSSQTIRGRAVVVSVPAAFAVFGVARWVLTVVGLEAAADPVSVSLAVLVQAAVVVLGLLFARAAEIAAEPVAERADLEAEIVQTFRELGSVEQLAADAAPLFWDRETWVHRRVERATFVDRTRVRRRISVDFEVPDPLNDPQPSNPYRWLPLSVLRDWPPVLNFDLRDADGSPLPLVSKSATNQLDERILLGVAEGAFGGSVPHTTAETLKAIIHGDARSARRAFVVVRDAVHQFVAERGAGFDPEPITRLLDLAAIFLDSTLLWVRVPRAAVGERRIIKLAYDEPVRRRLGPFRGLATSFGLRSLVVQFDIPHVGDSGSYHFEVEAPPSLEVIDGHLVLSSDPPAGNVVARLRRRLQRAREGFDDEIRVAVGKVNPYRPRGAGDRRNAELLTRVAHLYISGPRPRGVGAASMHFLPERRGVLTAALVVGVLVGAMMTAYNELALDIVSNASPALGPAVTFLLLAPGLLGYVLLRPTDHPFTARLLVGVRSLSIVAAALPVIAAGLLVARAADHSSDVLGWRDELMYASWGIAAWLILTWLLPLRNRWKRSD